MVSTGQATYEVVVPAQAGIHNPCALDGPVVMGPRVRGDDSWRDLSR
jgi:hypothetical protein